MARIDRTSSRREAPASKADLQAARRRQAILAAAVSVIASHGLSNTTIERVAGRAKVAAGTVLFYFGSKERLLLEALTGIAEEFDEARRKAIAKAGDDPAAGLAALVEVSFHAKVSAPDKVAVWYAFWGEANARKVYRDLVGSHDDDYEQSVRGLVQRLIDAGPREDLDADWVAGGFIGLLETLWQDILTESRAFDRKRAVRIARAYLTGVFQRPFP